MAQKFSLVLPMILTDLCNSINAQLPLSPTKLKSLVLFQATLGNHCNNLLSRSVTKTELKVSLRKGEVSDSLEMTMIKSRYTRKTRTQRKILKLKNFRLRQITVAQPYLIMYLLVFIILKLKEMKTT
jgi:hypothetical protein